MPLMVNSPSHGLGPTRARVLQLLQGAAGPLTVAQIAETLHLHKNSARFHLSALLEAGYVTSAEQHSGGQGRPYLVYTATGISPLVSNQHLFQLTHLLIRHFVDKSPHGTKRARELGEGWGADAASEAANADEAVAGLVSSMAERGFASVPDGRCVEIIRCPFRSDAISDSEMDVVCSIHQGYIDGYLSTANAGVEAKEMIVSPTSCHLELVERDEPQSNAG